MNILLLNDFIKSHILFLQPDFHAHCFRVATFFITVLMSFHKDEKTNVYLSKHMKMLEMKGASTTD